MALLTIPGWQEACLVDRQWPVGSRIARLTAACWVSAAKAPRADSRAMPAWALARTRAERSARPTRNCRSAPATSPRVEQQPAQHDRRLAPPGRERVAVQELRQRRAPGPRDPPRASATARQYQASSASGPAGASAAARSKASAAAALRPARSSCRPLPKAASAVPRRPRPPAFADGARLPSSSGQAIGAPSPVAGPGHVARPGASGCAETSRPPARPARGALARRRRQRQRGRAAGGPLPAAARPSG